MLNLFFFLPKLLWFTKIGHCTDESSFKTAIMETEQIWHFKFTYKRNKFKKCMGNSYMLSNRKHGAVWRTRESPLDYFLPTGLVQAASSLRLHLLNYQMGVRSQSGLILRGNDPYLIRLQALPCICTAQRRCANVYKGVLNHIMIYNCLYTIYVIFCTHTVFHILIRTPPPPNTQCSLQTLPPKFGEKNIEIWLLFKQH